MLNASLLSSEFDIFALLETWCDCTVTDAMILSNSDYAIIRKDRELSRGGGLLFLVKQSLTVNQLIVPVDLELLAIDVIRGSCVIVRLLCWYRSPSSSHDYFVRSLKCIESLLKCPQPCIILTDANLPTINWTQLSAINERDRYFLSWIGTNSLIQLVNEPTRGNNLLDLVLCEQSENIVSSLVVSEPYLWSDHNSIILSISCPNRNAKSQKRQPPTRPNFRKIDVDSAKKFLSDVDWKWIDDCCGSVDEFNVIFIEILRDCICRFVPCSKVHHRKHCIPRYLYRFRLYRSSLYNVRKNSHSNMLKYKKYDKAYCRALRKYFMSREKLLLKGDPHSLYRFMAQKKGSKTCQIPSLISNNSFVYDSKTKSELLASRFASCFSIDDGTLPLLCRQTESSLCFVNFSPASVRHALKCIAPKYGVGSDGIPMGLIKQLSSSLVYPLSLLFTFSLATCQIPEAWKTSIIVPVFKKKGSPADPTNYRPISKLSSICKIMEKIVTLQLYGYLELNNLLPSCQYGFRKGRSTTGQMLQCLSLWHNYVSSSIPADTIYLDFAHAFDSVPHNKLLFCCRQFGIGDPLLSWIEAYLRDRTLRVQVDEELSSPRPITSSIPQGGCLSPLLFILYTAPLLNQLTALGLSVHAYADDVKITSHCPKLLQAGLDVVSEWCKLWQLKLSIGKCTILPIYGGLNFNYSIDSIPLPPPNTEPLRDLGFILTPSLSFSEHCTRISIKARQMASLVLRSFTYSSLPVLLQAYIVYVRPLLEYGVPVFNSIAKRDSVCLENVQRWFTRVMFRRCHINNHRGGYAYRLRFCKLPTLESRRRTADLLFLRSVYFDKQYCPALVCKRPVVRMLKNNCRLVYDCSVKGKARSQWPYRVVPLWNTIPENVIRGSKSAFTTFVENM